MRWSKTSKGHKKTYRLNTFSVQHTDGMKMELNSSIVTLLTYELLYPGWDLSIEQTKPNIKAYLPRY